MKEWCLLHPWMTFFVLILLITLFINNNFIIIRGNKKFMVNLTTKGGIEMSDKSGNDSRKGNDTIKHGEPRSIYENANTVKPSSSPAPKAPGKQK